MVFLLSLAEHYDLKIETGYFFDRVGKQVESLLFRQSRDDSDEGHTATERRKPECTQDRSLARSLSLEILSAEWLWDQRVVRRIPFSVVNSVYYAPKIFLATPDYSFEPVTELRARLDLAGIILADGIEQVGKFDPDLHEVNSSPEFEGRTGEEMTVVDPRPIQTFFRVDSLVSKIVNGEERPNPAEERIADQVCSQ